MENIPLNHINNTISLYGVKTNHKFRTKFQETVKTNRFRKKGRQDGLPPVTRWDAICWYIWDWLQLTPP